MWIFRVFESAFVRKLAYMLAAMLFALVAGHRAYSQTCYGLVYTMRTGQGQTCSASSAAACLGQMSATVEDGNCVSGNASWSVASDDMAAGGHWTVNYSSTYSSSCGGGGSNTFTGNIAATSTAPCNNCTGLKPMDLLTAIGQASSAGANGYCVNGCQYVNSNTTLLIGGAQALADQAISTSSSCGPSAVTPAAVGAAGGTGQPTSTCVSKSGATDCVSTTGVSSAADTASVNNDVINPTTISPGTCVSYSDGGVACAGASAGSAVTAPPGPDNGTAGVPATPTAQVAVGSSGGLINFYAPSVVAGSANPVISTGRSGAGSNCNGSACVASGASAGSGASGGSGASDSAGGGQDCSAPPSCSGDAIYCAILNQEWLDRCYTVDPNAVASAVGVQVGEGASLVGSGIDVSSGLSEAGPITGGSTSCPAPTSVTVMGTTYSLDLFGYTCTFAGYLGTLIMLIAYFSGGLIMYRGVLA